MIRSFVCSVYLLAVCVTYPIQANDECLINHDLMDEIPSLNNQTTINAGSIQVLSDSTLELRNGFEIKFLQNARKLQPNEYTLHPQLGFISLNRRLNDGEALAVAYEKEML